MSFKKFTIGCHYQRHESGLLNAVNVNGLSPVYAVQIYTAEEFLDVPLYVLPTEVHRLAGVNCSSQYLNSH